MSSTARGGRRMDRDFYETRERDIVPVLRSLLVEGVPEWSMAPLTVQTVLDPGCGSGAFGKAIRRVLDPAPVLHGVEIDQNNADLARMLYARVWTEDFIGWYPVHSDFAKYDLAIGNPPFSGALEFVKHCLEIARYTCMLLPVNFTSSKKRREWFKKHPADILVLSARPSFAQSAKCVGPKGAERGCGWHVIVSLSTELPKKLVGKQMRRCCPQCGGNITVSTSDSNEYGYFLWGPGCGNRWAYAADVIETTGESVGETARLVGLSDERLRRKIAEDRDVDTEAGALPCKRTTRRTTPANGWSAFRPPPLPEAPAHEAARERVANMTAEQARKTFVDSGIIDASGKLTKPYR